jgi:hypothetical protein
MVQGLESPSAEVIGLVSHATQDRLKTLVSKLSVIAEHRLDIIKTEGPYEVTDVSFFFSLLKTVLWIWRGIRMLLDLPDPSFFCTDPDLSIKKQKK